MDENKVTGKFIEKKYLTVTALTRYIKRKFDADPHLQGVLVRGEISNFKKHTSGHMYFTLKDEKSRILAVMFSSFNRSLKFLPENGMKVFIQGDVTVYEQSGQYQIYVKHMQPDGIGDLYLAFEQLKEKLEKEGLFSPEHKRELPKFPKTIGVITSPTGAAIRDIITTIKRRYPIGRILIIPALVQGEQAPKSIVQAIEKANSMKEIDVLIVGRGGGSIEELWAFNDEKVARAIFSSAIPVISAVGHETDFTIADFVADLRAPTPTGAGELAVPHVDELMDRILSGQMRMMRTMKKRVRIEQERLVRLVRSYAFRNPAKIYEQKMERLDKSTEQLVRAADRFFAANKEKHLLLYDRLRRNHPKEKLEQAKRQFENLEKELVKEMANILRQKQSRFRETISTLEALSPLKVMERGYSLVYRDGGKLVKSIDQVEKDEDVRIQLSDGILACKVLDKKGEE